MTASQEDIRRLLRTFGIQADEAINARLREPGSRGPLRLRILLDELGEGQAERRLLAVEGEVQS